ncbi:centrosomal protein of 290 kDa [Diorhabda sublineata]|uniref:centrosomal protein of 290 kDa n=1 Tax=Diorhabda sublineata TaxID=1163346 RepID=UPI0024E0FAAD|nr:centrosomal protein of 290 kDa [Diorhabda sublineata]
MAVKQAEDEARRQESEADVRSSKSRKSSSIEYENLEQKYLELKVKHKKAIKINEKHEDELSKLNNKLKVIEKENKRLQHELQSVPQEATSESDYSESIKDQQKELVETLHNKNRQISDLLREIEEVENENTVLRDKLSKVRDELSVATKEIVSMVDSLKVKDEKLRENSENIEKLSLENEHLKEEYSNLKQEKQLAVDQLTDTLNTLKNQMKDLQESLDAKNEEIQGLKHRLKEPSLNSSLSSLPKDDPEPSQLAALQRALHDREQQLLEMQVQLRTATKEMEESTTLLSRLKKQKELEHERVLELEANGAEMKNQLKTTHDRCQKLHDNLVLAEETIRIKNEELNHVLEQLRNDGKIDLAENLKAHIGFKTQIKSQEKQIISLVRDTNRLQEAIENLEKENCYLRETSGLTQEEKVDLVGYTSKQRKLKKENEHLKNQLTIKDETIVKLKTEVHKLNKTVTSLTNQILELGHEPSHEFVEMFSFPRENSLIKKENKSLVEENEALRKGLHEVMACINEKKSKLEIKSDTFEKLLRALDIKHITGWYHPAMRLQAELHNLEGINTELREQLRQARIENKIIIIEKENMQNNEGDGTDGTASDSGIQSEEIILENIEDNIKLLFNKNKNPDTKDLSKIQQKILLWIKTILHSKTELEDEIKLGHNELISLKEEHNILLEKTKILISETDEEKVEKINDVILTNIALNRKVVYLENENRKLCEKIEISQTEFNNMQRNHLQTINNIQLDNNKLNARLKMLTNLNSTTVDFETYKHMEKNLNEMTIKYRELSAAMQKQADDKCLEFKTLLESQKSLQLDKEELKSKLMSLLSKQALININDSDDKSEKLSQKIAESEVKEITERQRANHINNLYELVREQLNKSEEKFAEFSKFNEELLKKNLNLQEHLKEMEEKICDYVDRTVYEKVKQENNKLIKENEELIKENASFKTQDELEKRSKEFERTWNHSKEQELLNLKHQIVDLISVSDEKVIIAQLSDDVIQNRKSVEFYKVSVNGLNEELEKMKDMHLKDKLEYERDRNLAEERERALNKQLGHLKTLLGNQRLQFYGYVPLTSEELYMSKIININNQEHESFLALQKAKEAEKEVDLLKQTLNVELNYLKQQKEIGNDSYKEEYKKMANWMQEKKTLQVNELRLKRQLEFKESELQHYMDRTKLQDEQIAKLDHELLQIYRHIDISDTDTNIKKVSSEEPLQKPESKKLIIPEPKPRTLKLTRAVSVQTNEVVTQTPTILLENNNVIANLRGELFNVREDLSNKESQINQLKSKITEHEMTISMFRKQIGDKQSQISFYERHIMELQNKKSEIANNGAGGDNINIGTESNGQTQENLVLVNSLRDLKQEITTKDEQIIKLQTLLKIDRDKHSLAAASLQEELQNIQKQLMDEKQKVKSLEENSIKSKTNRVAIEQYVNQVHALEQHASELHTKLSTLEAQLQSSRQEAIRWRTMANDRLTAMEDLRKNLEKQHESELALYKSDAEKLRDLGNDEINSLRQLIIRQKGELTGRLDTDIQRLVREKDDKIHEMIVKLRQMKTVKKNEQLDQEIPKPSDVESSKEMLEKEYFLLKKRYEQLTVKERSARNEIRELKCQLSKKPVSARSDKSEKSIKDQLQKKITSLQNEIIDLKQNLNEQLAINESHKIQASEDFDKWKKMKHFQQTAEKLKNKLKERDCEFEKLQQTSTGYRLLIERLEREKRNLENRIRTLKTSNVNVHDNVELEMFKRENNRLLGEVDALKQKLEIQQHHAGALGATMLQEKLEGQERKIAILELSSKGSAEMRTEMERLQSANSNLQKSNLRLEAENLDLKLDLEKCNKEVPHLHQQIQHLENYVDVLKSENAKQRVDNGTDTQPVSPETRKASELERTVFVLKRVVEKLQAENKRLVSGKRPLSDRSTSADKLKRDFIRLKEQHAGCVQTIENLQKELESTKKNLQNVTASKKSDDKIENLSEELSRVKEQLEVKSGLLDRVKILLHRAAAKEKALIHEIAELKSNKDVPISTIPEESEETSTDSET